MERGKKQEARSRKLPQSGSSSDTSNMEISFVTHDFVARARSEKQEARIIQKSPKPAFPNPALCLPFVFYTA